MKLKVLSDFRDRKHDLKLRKKNEVFEEEDQKRIEKLAGLGYVEVIQETEKKKG